MRSYGPYLSRSPIAITNYRSLTSILHPLSPCRIQVCLTPLHRCAWSVCEGSVYSKHPVRSSGACKNVDHSSHTSPSPQSISHIHNDDPQCCNTTDSFILPVISDPGFGFIKPFAVCHKIFSGYRGAHLLSLCPRAWISGRNQVSEWIYS